MGLHSYYFAYFIASLLRRYSAHVKRSDTILNLCLRLISGTIRSTPVEWLSVLSIKKPSDIQRKSAPAREANKTDSNPDLPILQDIGNHGDIRLISRKPSWVKMDEIGYGTYVLDEIWKDK